MKSTWATTIQRSSSVSNKAWAKNQSNDTKGRNLPNDWSERDAPLQSFGVEQDSLKEYDGVVNTKWWSVGMIEEHGWGNGYEKKANENCGRDKTVVWWVELVILHMVLLNDVQKIVVVPQIQYIVVCDATTNSPKLQVCSETLDICSKSMEWSMFLSWCRGSFPPFKTKKKLSASLNFVLFIVFWFQKMTLWEICGTLFSFLLKMFFVCALCCWSLCCGFVEIFIDRNKFLQKSFLMFFFFTKKLDVHLLRNTIFLILFYFFWWSFMDSCLFCGRNDTDIGRGSSVASSRPMSFLVISFHYFSVFSSFLFMIMCSSSFFLCSSLFCLILVLLYFSFLKNIFSLLKKTTSCLSSSCSISSCCSPFLWTLPFFNFCFFIFFLNAFFNTCHSCCVHFSLFSFFHLFSLFLFRLNYFTFFFFSSFLFVLLFFTPKNFFLCHSFCFSSFGFLKKNFFFLLFYFWPLLKSHVSVFYFPSLSLFSSFVFSLYSLFVFQNFVPVFFFCFFLHHCLLCLFLLHLKPLSFFWSNFHHVLVTLFFWISSFFLCSASQKKPDIFINSLLLHFILMCH